MFFYMPLEIRMPTTISILMQEVIGNNILTIKSGCQYDSAHAEKRRKNMEGTNCLE